MWRNWQTRWLQVPVGATPWRFKSSHPHLQLLQVKKRKTLATDDRPACLVQQFADLRKVLQALNVAFLDLIRRRCCHQASSVGTKAHSYMLVGNSYNRVPAEIPFCESTTITKQYRCRTLLAASPLFSFNRLLTPLDDRQCILIGDFAFLCCDQCQFFSD